MLGQVGIVDNPSLTTSETRKWVEIVRGDYLVIPGLQLTRNQVQRLWGLDAATCEVVINALVDAGFLRRSPAGAYVRANESRGAFSFGTTRLSPLTSKSSLVQ
jgi:hypothetical protein